MSQKIAFQGVLGAYSHMAAQATLPDYEDALRVFFRNDDPRTRWQRANGNGTGRKFNSRPCRRYSPILPDQG